MNTLNNFQQATPESVWAILQETAQLDKKLREEAAQLDKKLREEAAQLDKKFSEKLDRDLQKSREEFDRQTKKFHADLGEIKRIVKANSKEIGGISKSNGEVAESYFINSFKKYPHFAGQDFQSLESNKSSYSKALELKDEYDLVLYNGVSVVIIEIKYKAKKEDIEQVLTKAETFKKLFPQYKDFAIYLGLAGLHVYQNAEKEATKQGIAVIKQVGKSMVITDENLKAF
jgi:hypothetical protein